MAKTKKKAKAKAKEPRRSLFDRLADGIRALRRLAVRVLLAAVALILLWVAAYRVIDPPGTPYIWSEADRLGGVAREWRDLDQIAPVMARAAVAAEDANFCLHWGFDVDAIKDAIEEGAGRGASTISQQVVKNAFLWQGRSWPRKALEAMLTPVMEAFWPKRRIIEVYLNVAEFGEGVFGVEAAARHYFGVSADALTPAQAAALASVLPNPKRRDPTALTPALQRKAALVRDGAATIAADGRAACFES
ncbi:monofunctional biosynthetic peptidoglycan transglycosylase [Jannaschia seohaensis]|uniref:Biosynthetic peptidoglycan transglycosylase n=1 Tax=Jannaschia seohaensis TaxID=475081 RepID=A0A2Y9C825_9RHOB|nr:monofunctional biosynthetic peptidoglycan transglycosylase [Jannaschia seohaensis]PWJ17500.1 monofunctional biosynthetic peptidoglycan transglycosylase [Jannaschia seohaensis]SSA47613.1 monofunctional biosynthetic peptidoglycan transglycosylase [Jannaschia seohaensis]